MLKDVKYNIEIYIDEYSESIVSFETSAPLMSIQVGDVIRGPGFNLPRGTFLKVLNVRHFISDHGDFITHSKNILTKITRNFPR